MRRLCCISNPIFTLSGKPALPESRELKAEWIHSHDTSARTTTPYVNPISINFKHPGRRSVFASHLTLS